MPLDFSASFPNLSILISRRTSLPSTKAYVKTRLVLRMEAILKMKHAPRRISILGSLPGVQLLMPWGKPQPLFGHWKLACRV